ncbi:alpha/beta fold hydrolase [Nonomuraea dietziae]|uniref:alpha/beta fold hydrolase n=1 Tax=Nonomuraea dietziae TaxID=65515 RepID=UPI00343144BE
MRGADLVGFGRSDKPADRFAYTYQSHVDWLRETVFDRLDLRDVTMVRHDWGGLLGLRLLAEHPDRYRRVVATNTVLHAGDQGDMGPAARRLPHRPWRADPLSQVRQARRRPAGGRRAPPPRSAGQNAGRAGCADAPRLSGRPLPDLPADAQAREVKKARTSAT